MNSEQFVNGILRIVLNSVQGLRKEADLYRAASLTCNQKKVQLDNMLKNLNLYPEDSYFTSEVIKNQSKYNDLLEFTKQIIERSQSLVSKIISGVCILLQDSDNIKNGRIYSLCSNSLRELTTIISLYNGQLKCPSATLPLMELLLRVKNCTMYTRTTDISTINNLISKL